MKKKDFTILYKGLAGGALLLLSGSASAQVASQAHLSPEVQGYLQRATEMMATGNFLGASDQLGHLTPSLLSTLTPQELRECEFQLAMAKYELDDASCLTMLRNWIEKYPGDSRYLQAALTIGDYYFFNKEYGAAALEYDKIDLSALSGDEKAKYTYRKALSLLKCGEQSAPRELFRSLTGNKEYSTAANFYLAYISYVDGDLDKAYKGFAAIRGSNSGKTPTISAKRRTEYKPTGLEAGYYMTQIDFKKEDYERVINNGRSLIQKEPVEELLPEMYRVVGESYFRLGDYLSAGQYLEKYVAMAGENANHSAIYDLGVVKYDEGELEDAEQLFSRLTEERDAIGQGAWLYLGQCAVKEGRDSEAAMAFSRAYQWDFDPKVTETALYNYVAAGTRGGNIPFTSSIDMLEDFLSRFPNSEYAPTVREYLAAVYYNEKNYAKALQSINRIKNPGGKVLEAKQKVLYELGVEALSNNSPAAAETYMTEAISLSDYDASLAREATLWLADAQYAQGKYRAAAQNYEKYIAKSSAGSNRTLALYDLAYTLYMEGKYSQAAQKFESALGAKPQLNKTLRGDATIRLGDCLYYTRDYKGATAQYDKAIADDAAEADYATYRRAIMYGLSGDYTKKLAELNAMPQKYPYSKWLASAKLEKALTYQALEKDDAAVAAYQDLASTYPNSAEARKGMLEMANALNRAGKTQKAIDAYKEVISRWPSSEEAQLANEDLKQIYSELGKIDEYMTFLASVPGAPRIEPDELERLTFESAQLNYSSKGDTAGLERYARDYPQGIYLAQALLDLSEAYSEKGKSAEALKALDQLLQKKGDSPLAAEALLRKGELLEKSGADNAKITATYEQLLKQGGPDYAVDAYSGIMRNTPQAAERIKYAQLVQQSGALENDQREEAEYYEALGWDQMNERSKAIALYSRLAEHPKTLYGARGAVALGQLYYDTKQYKKAEDTLTKFTDSGTPHLYWLARGYLLLADTYYAQGKKAMALEYVRSLRDNYPGDEADIKNMINKRLNGAYNQK